MVFLDYQHWLFLATLTLATLLAGRFGVRGAAKNTSRRPLEILHDPGADKDVPPSGRKNNHTVECVFASQHVD